MNLRSCIASALLLSVTGACAGIVNRWSFNQPTGAAAAGTTMADSVSGSPAVVRGINGSFTGTSLLLPGTTTGNQTPGTISAYIDLPNGMISSKANLTVEIWASPVSYQAYQRLLDFGRVAQAGDGLGAAGEITGLAATAPGATQASDGLTLTLCRNTANNLSQQRFEGKLNGVGAVDGTGLYRIADTDLATTANTEYHYVLTFEDGVGAFGTNGGRLTWYRDGALAASVDVGFHLNQVEDVNNWLGRSLWSGDRQANAAYNEVRVYNHVFSPTELAASRAAGPNPSPATAAADSVTMHHGQKAAIPVTANDTNAVSVVIAQQPQFGTVSVDAIGRILYTHTQGTPVSDSFTYRATNAAGQSAPATVTVNFTTALRIANNTLNVPQTPPLTAVQLPLAFGGLAFTQPTALVSPPGNTSQLFVCEKTGSIKVIPDVAAAVPASLNVLTLTGISSVSEQGVLGLAFHPSYASNGYFYVFYSANVSGTIYERVSRFTMSNPGAPAPAVVAGSELVLIQQQDDSDNHNGGDLHFGPDGYLYISLGDEGGQNDQNNNSQLIDKDFFSGILRIDVNLEGAEIAGGNPNDPDDANRVPQAHASIPLYGGLPAFEVPVDNPFVHTSRGGTWNGVFNGSAIANLGAVRDEFWAIGLRNPWRMSFDSGELWCGDVGGNLREEVNIITRGGNYGWAYREGTINGPKSAQAPAGFTSNAPLYEYLHGGGQFQGNSITGGIVYRGSRFPAFFGAYFFADYVSGNIWSLRRNGVNPPTVERIAGEMGISAFGKDPSNGDVLLADIDGNRILRLVIDTPSGAYPASLSATGIFADLSDLSPAPGLLPYTPNLPFWSDHANKRRWFIVPDAISQMTWSRDGLWTFPSGAIWVKHFDLELTRGNPATRKRIETRLLVKNSAGAYGVSYRWNEAQTEATLVADAGADFDLAITQNGQPSTQHWHIPSRAECMACHTPQSGHVLSFTTRQMNLSGSIPGFSGNQLQLLHAAGYFSNNPGSPNVLPRHLRPEETSYPVEARVRSYLAVNCAYCHKAGGTASPAAWDGRPEITLEATGLINGAASSNGGNPVNKLVVPGDTLHSVVYNRVAAANGFTRMPPLATSELDQANVALLAEWITQSLPSRQTYNQWRAAQFGDDTSPAGEPGANPDGDSATNAAEFLALTNPMHGGSILVPQVAAGCRRWRQYHSDLRPSAEPFSGGGDFHESHQLVAMGRAGQCRAPSARWLFQPQRPGVGHQTILPRPAAGKLNLMHKNLLLFAVCLSQVLRAAEPDTTSPELFRDTQRPLEARIADLISRLTLEEKASLLNHKGRSIERFQIRADQWNQCLNGVKWDRPATLFPTCIAMAATWNPELVQHEIARVLSDEARAIYNGWHINPTAPGEHKGLIYRAPVINIERNPYWGRNHEAWGEDPFLTGRMGVAYVRGLQGDDPHHLKLAATLKHYAVNNVEADRLKLNAVVPERFLREYWLPHFRDAVVEGKAQSLMASYNAINGTPNNINRWLLTDLLKKEWKHEGFVVSDLGGVKTMVEGHTKKQMTYVDAVAQSLMAGCDFSDKEFEENIPAAVREGKLSEERLNDALTRVLRVRFRLGEFDPFASVSYSKISPEVVGSSAHRAIALKTAQQSIVLLQNRGNLLPLDRTQIKRIAVLGPFADQVVINNYNGKTGKVITAVQGITDRVGPGVQVLYGVGGTVGGKPHEWMKEVREPEMKAAAELEKAVALAKDADVAVVFVGTNATIEHEGRDRQTLGLTGNQEELVKAVFAANPRVVVVQMSAGPLTVPWLRENIPAMLQAWWPGEEGGHAIADVLFGDVNPAGRLPHTVYASEAQVPPREEYDISKGFTYMYLNGAPLYPFGHGLSYTEFAYSNLRVSSSQIPANGTVTVTVEVKNTGKKAGDEVAQLYVHEVDPAVKRPSRELRGFHRVSLQPGEARDASFILPAEKIAYWSESEHGFIVKPGAFDLWVGSSSEDIRARTQIKVTAKP